MKNIYHYFQRLAAKYYLKLFTKVEIIGVTGSVGKTTTKEMIALILSEKFKVLVTIANIDPIYNIPLTIFKLKPGVQKLIVELSVDHFGDMDKYFAMVKPIIGVFTPIDYTHTEFLKDLDGVISEKGKLAEVLPKDGWLVLNKDDINHQKIMTRTKAKIYYYGEDTNPIILRIAKNLLEKTLKPFLGQENKENDSTPDLLATKIKSDSLNGVSFELIDQKTKESEIINLKLLGRQNVTCALAAASVGRIYNLSLKQIKTGLEKVKPIEARMNLIKLSNGSYLINDAYNASPLAVKSALETVNQLKITGQRIAVLGEMKELGDYSQKGHEEVAKAVAANNFQTLIVFGELTKYMVEIVKKLKPEITVYQPKTMKEILEQLKKITKEGDIILLKGSKFTHMERIVLGLQGRKISCNQLTCKKYINCRECSSL